MANKPQFRVGGALFEVENPNGPAFSGVIQIEGVEYKVACWPKTSAAGKNYLQISEDKRAREASGGGGQQNRFTQRAIGGPSPGYKLGNPPDKPGNRNDDMDDDIPF